jgi:dihydroneopterin aldolase
MDSIELKNMVFHAFHGVMEQEKKTGNRFRVDLKLHLDLSLAIQSDNLEDTLNYACVFDLVKAEMNIPSQLLEHVAGRIVQRIKQTFPAIDHIEIRLAKAHPPVDGELEEAAISISI